MRERPYSERPRLRDGMKESKYRVLVKEQDENYEEGGGENMESANLLNYALVSIQLSCVCVFLILWGPNFLTGVERSVFFLELWGHLDIPHMEIGHFISMNK